MDNISNAQIQSSLQRAQAEGVKTTAQLYGAVAAGKAEKEQRKTDDTPELYVQVDIHENPPQSSEKNKIEQSKNISSSKDKQELELNLPSKEEILNKGFEISEDSMRTAEAIVNQQVKDIQKKDGFSKLKPLGEPKLLDLRLEESIKIMDIHDLMSGKPLPPVMDEDYPILGTEESK